MQQTMEGLQAVRTEAQDFAALALRWLMRAWQETDTISKFVSYLSLLEFILSKVKQDPKETEEIREKSEKIRNLLEMHAGDQKRELLDFFNRFNSSQPPGLFARFKILAEEAKLDGWQEDIKAFRKFYNRRNDLIHAGKMDITLAENEIQLEDLTERYLNWVLFRDSRVYSSSWRKGLPQ